MSPVIGVTTSRHTLADRIDRDRVYLAFVAYTAMVRAAGGIPVALVPGPVEEVDAILDRLDGLLLAGGGDVNPALYGGGGHDTVYGVDPDRDGFEVGLVVAARRRGLPTLCVCRGMQVANVAFGGSLIADIAGVRPGAFDHRRTDQPASKRQHRVDVEPGSTTATALGTATVEVNSLHHQAIDSLARGLVVTGVAPDGIIEAVEPEDAAWPMWAVQWHPEGLGPDDEPSLNLFRTFVAAAERGGLGSLGSPSPAPDA